MSDNVTMAALAIETASNKELEMDRLESLSDIKTCKKALKLGIETYSGGSVLDRLNTNLKIVQIIEAEQKRRKDHERT